MIGSRCFLFLFLSFPFVLPAQEDLRQQMAKACPLFFADPELARKSWETLSPQRVASDPRLQAYRGAACFALARFEKKIDAKKKWIVEGIKWVEQAVNKMPEDVEIRLLRFSIQSNLPPAAGYAKHQGQDKLFITQNISRIPDESRRREILNLLSP
jgi:hypothetical protein